MKLPKTAAVVVVALVIGMAGCTSTEPVGPSSSVPSDISPQAKDLVDQAFADPALNDFERSVLSDYLVTDQEANEAKDRYIQCMADNGWVAEIDANWQTTVYPAPGSGHSGAEPDSNNQCMIGSLHWIEPVYLEEQNNPEGLSYAQQVRACFTKNGLPDGDGLSDDQIQQMAMKPNADLHPSSAPAYLCTIDPMGSQGVSLATAEQLFNELLPQWGVPQPSGSPS